MSAQSDQDAYLNAFLQYYRTHGGGNTLGIRSNNWTNVHRSGRDPWVGTVGYNYDLGPGHVRFSSPQLGMRAGALNIINKIRRGQNTLGTIVYGQPGQDNAYTGQARDRAAYAAFLSRVTGIPLNQRLNASDFNQIKSVLRGLTAFENGTVPPNFDQVANAGLEMAMNNAGLTPIGAPPVGAYQQHPVITVPESQIVHTGRPTQIAENVTGGIGRVRSVPALAAAGMLANAAIRIGAGIHSRRQLGRALDAASSTPQATPQPTPTIPPENIPLLPPQDIPYVPPAPEEAMVAGPPSIPGIQVPEQQPGNAAPTFADETGVVPQGAIPQGAPPEFAQQTPSELYNQVMQPPGSVDYLGGVGQPAATPYFLPNVADSGEMSSNPMVEQLLSPAQSSLGAEMSIQQNSLFPDSIDYTYAGNQFLDPSFAGPASDQSFFAANQALLPQGSSDTNQESFVPNQGGNDIAQFGEAPSLGPEIPSSSDPYLGIPGDYGQQIQPPEGFGQITQPDSIPSVPDESLAQSTPLSANDPTSNWDISQGTGIATPPDSFFNQGSQGLGNLPGGPFSSSGLGPQFYGDTGQGFANATQGDLDPTAQDGPQGSGGIRLAVPENDFQMKHGQSIQDWLSAMPQPPAAAPGPQYISGWGWYHDRTPGGSPAGADPNQINPGPVAGSFNGGYYYPIYTPGVGTNAPMPIAKGMSRGGPVMPNPIYATQGMIVPGPRINRDVVPMMAKPGEIVLNESQQRQVEAKPGLRSDLAKAIARAKAKKPTFLPLEMRFAA